LKTNTIFILIKYFPGFFLVAQLFDSKKNDRNDSHPPDSFYKEGINLAKTFVHNFTN